MEPTRKFKIIINSKECGTCSGPTPSAVAKKVIKKLCGTSSKVVKFSLKECKRGCERVCGPYQGRMEKLDRPYKRGGKTITHRVVCGKVKKMRGGALSSDNFIKGEPDDEFKIDKIGLRPHIFFGEVEVGNQRYYKYVIFNNEHFGGNKKTCGFNELKINGESISIVPITGKKIVGEKNNNQQQSNNHKNTGNGNNNNRPSENIQNNNQQQSNNNNTNYEQNKENLRSLLENLLYCKKLTDYKTIRITIYKLLKNRYNLFDSLGIPSDFFERDYLPEVITAEGECVPKGFYKLLPDKLEDFKSERPGHSTDIRTEVIAETNASKRPNFLKRKVYYTVYESKKYIYFSKKQDSEYYNIAIVCNENNTIYIGIYNPRTGIVKFYPIDKDIFSRFTYPSDFLDLIYLYYPYVHKKYYPQIDMKLDPDINLILVIKVLEFYSEYISSTIKTLKGVIDINDLISKISNLKQIQENKQRKQRKQREQQEREQQEREQQEREQQEQRKQREQQEQRKQREQHNTINNNNN